MKKIILIMVLFICTSAYGLDMSPQEKIVFVDKANGWSGGASGEIWHTDNGGKSWQKQVTGFEDTINALSFIDKNTGWAVCSVWDESWTGYILYTANSGKTWQKRGQVSDQIRDIMFKDKKNGWMVTGKYANGKILHTTNGGVSWSQQRNPNGEILNSVYFLDNSYGWTCGANGVILHTSNGGADWVIQKSRSMNNLNRIFFKDALHGWAVGDRGTILYTNDGGEHWKIQVTNDMHTEFSSVWFTDENTGWIASERGVIYSTKNGGYKWVPISKTLCDIKYIIFINSDEGYAACDQGLMAIKNKGDFNII